MKAVRTVLMAAALSMTPPSAEAKEWTAERRIDKFTDIESCRVAPGGAMSRSFKRGLLSVGVAYYFFAEKRGEEVRAGLYSEPAYPISGDVQIRVDDDPVITITAADTPLDVAPTMPALTLSGLSPEQRALLEKQQHAMLASASPYRALTGDRALELIKSVVDGKLVRTRTVGINSATSTAAEWKPHPDLRVALGECGIVP